jgi:hypothetical protein
MGGTTKVQFRLKSERIEAPLSRFVVEITSEGRSLVMLVPLVLQNGNWETGPLSS